MKTFEKPLTFISHIGHYFLPKTEAARKTQIITAVIILIVLFIALILAL